MLERYRNYLVLGCLGAGLSVALGAFAAHGLKAKLSEGMLEVFQTGVDYQAYHSLAMLVLVTLALMNGKSEDAESYLNRSLQLMLWGIILFSGSLYALALSGIGKFGMITPVGGVLFLLAWGFAARGIWCFGKLKQEQKG
jgi:uncharacterized membrane protein YgdD (TMEM256/DUF423 family)